MRTKTVLCWSSGKDSAWSLWQLRGRDDVEVVGLMTTVAGDCAPMHGVTRALILEQAAAAGLPVTFVEIPPAPANDEYDRSMRAFVEAAYTAGVRAIAFGDLFLEDIRVYRESRLAGTGLEPMFPLWGVPTDRLARDMIAGGLRARIVSVDTTQLDRRFAGREFDASLLDDLPATVDPCGERGEFHTVVHAGPMFSRAITLAPPAEPQGERFALVGVEFG